MLKCNCYPTGIYLLPNGATLVYGNPFDSYRVVEEGVIVRPRVVAMPTAADVKRTAEVKDA